MVMWFLIYTTVMIVNGTPSAETHYRRYTTQVQCNAAKDAFNGTDNMFAECFSSKVEQPASTPKTSL